MPSSACHPLLAVVIMSSWSRFRCPDQLSLGREEQGLLLHGTAASGFPQSRTARVGTEQDVGTEGGLAGQA
jgi:hypothetical protein